MLGIMASCHQSPISSFVERYTLGLDVLYTNDNPYRNRSISYYSIAFYILFDYLPIHL